MFECILSRGEARERARCDGLTQDKRSSFFHAESCCCFFFIAEIDSTEPTPKTISSSIMKAKKNVTKMLSICRQPSTLGVVVVIVVVILLVLLVVVVVR